MIDKLKAWSKARGYEIAWGSASVLKDVNDEFDQLEDSGKFKADIYQELLSWLRLEDPKPFPNPETVFAIAVPRPTHKLVFELPDDRIETILPPTYVKHFETREAVRRDLSSSVFEDRYKTAILKAPLKALAARLGLVSYGRNNITYVPGMGSFFQLVGVITDAVLPSNTNTPGKAKPCPECQKCKVCIKACPTEAIQEERFLLRGEKCFVRYSENQIPWPSWLLPKLEKCFSAQTCLVGCLLCQLPCPMNKGRVQIEDAGVSFTAEETGKIIVKNTHGLDSLEDETREKIQSLGLTEFQIIGRNLRELLKYHKSGILKNTL